MRCSSMTRKIFSYTTVNYCYLIRQTVAIIAKTGAVNWNVTKSEMGNIFTETNCRRRVTAIAILQITAEIQHLKPAGSSPTAATNQN